MPSSIVFLLYTYRLAVCFSFISTLIGNRNRHTNCHQTTNLFICLARICSSNCNMRCCTCSTLFRQRGRSTVFAVNIEKDAGNWPPAARSVVQSNRSRHCTFTFTLVCAVNVYGAHRQAISHLERHNNSTNFPQTFLSFCLRPKMMIWDDFGACKGSIHLHTKWEEIKRERGRLAGDKASSTFPGYCYYCVSNQSWQK